MNLVTLEPSYFDPILCLGTRWLCTRCIGAEGSDVWSLPESVGIDKCCHLSFLTVVQELHRRHQFMLSEEQPYHTHTSSTDVTGICHTHPSLLLDDSVPPTPIADPQCQCHTYNTKSHMCCFDSSSLGIFGDFFWRLRAHNLFCC